MKKIGKSIRKALLAAIILSLVLCAGCTGNPPEPAGDTQPPAAEEAAQAAPVNPLDAAFAAGETIRLVPADLPGSPGENDMPVGISPDGKTVLWRNNNGLTVTRGGETHPVIFDPERGAGDPYGAAEGIHFLLMQMPYWEGISWSADGRYAALSALELASSGRYPGPVVLDTDTGEVFLAKAYNLSRSGENAGIVFLTRIDRAGRYLYYLAEEFEEDGAYIRFCRCPVEGGEREILCDTPIADRAFEPGGFSALYETADGSWFLNGITGTDSSGEDYRQHALVRFSPAGDTWTREIIPLGIPQSGQSCGSVSCFAQSGYGLFDLHSSNVQSMAATSSFASADLSKASIPPYFMKRIGLLRILPGGEAQHDVWGLVKTADGSGVELIPSYDLLWAIKVQSGKIAPDENAEALIWLTTHYNEGEDLLDKYYPQEMRERDLRDEGVVSIQLTCMSPDGRYALMNAGSGQSGDRLYMLSLETMEIRPVEAPEGLVGISLSHSPFGATFKPGIVWNEDGTLLIHASDTGRTAAYRLETGSVQE